MQQRVQLSWRNARHLPGQSQLGWLSAQTAASQEGQTSGKEAWYPMNRASSFSLREAALVVMAAAWRHGQRVVCACETCRQALHTPESCRAAGRSVRLQPGGDRGCGLCLRRCRAPKVRCQSIAQQQGVSSSHQDTLQNCWSLLTGSAGSLLTLVRPDTCCRLGLCFCACCQAYTCCCCSGAAQIRSPDVFCWHRDMQLCQRGWTDLQDTPLLVLCTAVQSRGVPLCAAHAPRQGQDATLSGT